MAVKVSGLASGLDTDSIVKELVSAYATKKDKYVKQQTKMEWTMDAWSTTNSKVYSFYSLSLSQMRYSSSYGLRSASISNSTIASVSAASGAVAGTQSLSVKQLATSGYLTSGKINTTDGTTLTADTKLSSLGIGEGRINVNGTNIDITADMSITDLVSGFKKAGLSASFDAGSGRLFINSASSGVDKEFTMTAGNQGGLDALMGLGLMSIKDTDNNETADMKLYREMAAEGYNASAEIESRYANKAWTVKSYTDNLKNIVSEATTARDSLKSTQDALQKERASMNDDTYVWSDHYSTKEEFEKARDELTKKISDNSTKLSEYDNTITTNQALLDSYKEDDDTTGFAVSMKSLNDAIHASIENDVTDEVNMAKTIVAGVDGGTIATSAGSARITAKDAIISLNGAEFTGNTNSFSINGLTINATGVTTTTSADGKVTDNPVTISTSVDTQGIYDKIKSFLSAYNEMVGYIDKQYYADSASGYEPLTDDEKESMTDKQIEAWEEKVKTALLRKDSTLGDISTSLKNTFLSTSVDINGDTYNLSSFGIATLSFFQTAAEDRGQFHIDGNADDAKTSANADKLMAAIANDPDAVMEYFQTLSQNVYDVLTKKMSSTSISNAFTIYNDKEMSSQYSDYTDKVDEWEDKLKDYEDYYYKKFTAMETALQKLQSQTSSLSNLLGS